MGLGDAAQEARGDDRVREDAGAREGGELSRLLAEDRADLVARELAPAAGGVLVRDGRGAAVGVGVVSDDEVRADLLGQGQGEVEGAGLLDRKSVV